MSLATNVTNLATRMGTESKGLRTLINGNQSSLAALTTVDKTNLVAAINELAALISTAGADIDDATISSLSVWSSSKTDSTINAAVAALIAASPAALDTLNELAAALGNDANFATTINNAIALRAPLASPTFTGAVTVPDASFTIAKTSGLQGALDSKIAGFVDPNADRIVFWDDSAGAYAALSLTGLTITGTALTVNAASEAAAGIAEQASLAEVTTGTDAVRYVTPQGVRQEINTRAPTAHTHTAANITDFSTAVPAAVPAASETVAGKLELATSAEATAGVDTTRAITAVGLKAVGDTKAPISHTHTAANITDFSTAADARVNALIPAATELVAGKVELATTVEATTGTDTTRAITAAGLKAVGDTKAPTVHGHALTDANITGILPIAQVPTGTSGTTVALGNHGHVAANISDFTTTVDGRVNTLVPAASLTVAGKVELATDAEVALGTDTSRAVTSVALRSVTGDPETNYVTVFEAALV